MYDGWLRKMAPPVKEQVDILLVLFWNHPTKNGSADNARLYRPNGSIPRSRRKMKILSSELQQRHFQDHEHLFDIRSRGGELDHSCLSILRANRDRPADVLTLMRFLR